MNYTCKICDFECGAKGFPLHIKKHGYTFKEYVKEYIEDFKPLWKLCPICNENVTDKITCSKKCGKLHRSIKDKGLNIWNRMDEETRIEAKKSISEKASVRQKGRNIWFEMSEDVKERAKSSIASKTSKRCTGSGNPMYGKMWTEEMIKKIVRRRKTNKLEKKMEDFLIESKIPYKKQFYQQWNGRRYFYDFHIIETSILIETDGDYWHGGPGVKQHHSSVNQNKKIDADKSLIANERGFKLLRFWESEIKEDFQLVKDKIVKEIKKEQNETC